ncbi:(2Fe-2S)-binding protein [Pyrobaculum aerophilum]|uniref:(2Fe-2S)-binding protein n=2 Tax=Pyrobaculum aerophilum TaxID=13773 RepID=A0A371QYC8_9CREN|nr:(2Fe-2S)-binding protein [Pyrobaculum aerophilum]
MVDENRRNTLKIFFGTMAALGAGMLATPLVASVIGGKAGYIKPEPSGAIPVEICKDVDSCPEDYGVSLDELRNGPVFKLLKVNTMAIPAVFGIVRAKDGKEYPVAYVAICTHFGCPVNVSGGIYLIGFNCPCHGSIFAICNDPNGCPDYNAAFLEMYVSGGPAPRPLRAIKVAVKDGVVYPLVAYI